MIQQTKAHKPIIQMLLTKLQQIMQNPTEPSNTFSQIQSQQKQETKLEHSEHQHTHKHTHGHRHEHGQDVEKDVEKDWWEWKLEWGRWQKSMERLGEFLVYTLLVGMLVMNVYHRHYILSINTISTSTLKQPEQFYQFQKLTQIKQLPFCLILLPSPKYPESTLLSSLQLQSHKNYHHFTINQSLSTPQSPPFLNNTYHQILPQIHKTCHQNSFLLFLNLPLKSQALKYINQNLQKWRAWMVYVQGPDFVDVVGIYQRVYWMLGRNDFYGVNWGFLEYANTRVQALSMFDLCKQSAKKLQKSKIYISEDEPTYFSIQLNKTTDFQRFQYLQLYRLSQDHPQFDYLNFQKKRRQLPTVQIPTQFQLSLPNMLRALDRQQSPYLPLNHSITQLQHLQYSTKYSINKYTNISQQTPFCVTIMSHNNIQSDRYIKVLKSILIQQYQNYHIVFIDDVSTDGTLEKTVEYLGKMGFPQERVKYVRNLERNYATYNIINAAFNYCGEGDVQLLVDGDDQLIGRYAFQVLNSAYRKNPDLWVVYSSYKTNYLGYGRSWRIDEDRQHIDQKTGKRRHLSFLGPIRTWRVQLLFHITLQNHKMSNGKWLDTGYDDALIHPLVQLATLQKILYINEILYQYNRQYGGNDDSTEEKIRHRLEVYQYLSGLKMLEKVERLEGSRRDEGVWGELRRDYGVRYVDYKGL